MNYSNPRFNFANLPENLGFIFLIPAIINLFKTSCQEFVFLYIYIGRIHINGKDKTRCEENKKL